MVDRARVAATSPRRPGRRAAAGRRRSGWTARTARPSSAAGSVPPASRRPWSGRSSPRRSGRRRPSGRARRSGRGRRRSRRCAAGRRGAPRVAAGGGVGVGLGVGSGVGLVGSGVGVRGRLGRAARRPGWLGLGRLGLRLLLGLLLLVLGALPRPRRRGPRASSAAWRRWASVDADVLQVGELGDQRGLLVGDRLASRGRGVGRRWAACSRVEGVLLRPARRRRGRPAAWSLGDVGERRRPPGTRRTCRRARPRRCASSSVRSMTVSIPSEWTIADSAVRPGAARTT